MKIQNMIRMQAVVIGFGAAMLLASAAPAQEIDNPTWDEGTNSTPLTQAAPAPTANNSNSAVADPTGATPVATVAQETVTQAGVVPGKVPVERLTIASLLVCIGLVVVYMRENKKDRKRYLSVQTAGRSKSRAALS
jgi:hypothetical protein